MSIIVYGDTSMSPELRNEMPLSVPDPFLYVERDGRQVVVVAGFEVTTCSIIRVGGVATGAVRSG